MPTDVRLIHTLEDAAIADYLAMKFDTSQQCLMAVAYGTYPAFKRLGGHINTMLRNSGELRVILDTQSLITTPELIEEFATVPGNCRCKIYAGGAIVGQPKIRSFHPKMICFKNGKGCEFLIGSANFTQGGLENNIEVGTVISCHESDPFAKSSYQLWNQLWHHPDVLSPSSDFIDQYRRLHARFKPQVARVEKKLAAELKQLLSQEAKALIGGGGSRLSYLLGLVCGAAHFSKQSSPTHFDIVLQSGERNHSGIDPGTIAAPGISSFKTDQRDALLADAERIQATLNDWLRASKQGSVELNRTSDFIFRLPITLRKNSPAAKSVAQVLHDGNIANSRFYPANVPRMVAESSDNDVTLSFFRGYFDVRGRVSIADRAGTNGALRIAISVSANAEVFGKQLNDAITKHFGLEHSNYLHGPERQRETLIRMEAQEAPTQLFTSAWQQILHHDFAKYNENHYNRTNRFQGKLSSED